MQSNEDKRQLKKESTPVRSAAQSSSPETASNDSNEGATAQEVSPPQGAQNAELDEDMESGPMANAPFVNKVWLIVNNPANHQYIRWVPGGKSILIVDREGFEKQSLPYYFKHKRFTSFVRQLNMYGWHKVQDLSAGTMQSNEEHWQFANPNFIQGQPESSKDIVRNKGHKPTASASHNNASQNSGTNGAEKEDASTKSESSKNLQAILNELEQIKNRQHAIGEDLGRMRKDNESSWTEYYQTRERYDKHSQVSGRILRFLATIYGNQSKILDSNDPMNEIMMQGGNGTSHSQHYLNLLPASQQPHFDSGIHDSREIEQSQHQIEEASTPGSTIMNGASPGTPASYTSGRPSIVSQHSRATPVDTTETSNPPIRNTNPRGAANTNTAANSLASTNSRRLSNSPYWVEPEPNANNQLVRATPNRVNNVNARSGTPLAIPAAAANSPPDLPNYPNASNRISPYESPQLQEVPADSRPIEDPAQLFPELGDLSAPDSMPSLTSQELEQITREIQSNGTSSQNIQDWLAKQNLDNDEHFNVDDFLNNDEGTSPAAGGDGTNTGRKNSSVEEPDKKRVRVS